MIFFSNLSMINECVYYVELRKELREGEKKSEEKEGGKEDIVL